MTCDGTLIFDGWDFPLLVVRFGSLSQLFDSNLRDPVFLLSLVSLMEFLVNLVGNGFFDLDYLRNDVNPVSVSYIRCCRRGFRLVLRRVHVDGGKKRSGEGKARLIGMEWCWWCCLFILTGFVLSISFCCCRISASMPGSSRCGGFRMNDSPRLFAGYLVFLGGSSCSLGAFLINDSLSWCSFNLFHAPVSLSVIRLLFLEMIDQCTLALVDVLREKLRRC